MLDLNTRLVLGDFCLFSSRLISEFDVTFDLCAKPLCDLHPKTESRRLSSHTGSQSTPPPLQEQSPINYTLRIKVRFILNTLLHIQNPQFLFQQSCIGYRAQVLYLHTLYPSFLPSCVDMAQRFSHTLHPEIIQFINKC